MFESLDLRVGAGGLLVVHGPGGSGRTSLLLALAARMRLDSGAVRVGGHLLPGAERQVRDLVAVARAEPAVGLDGRLRVSELIAERRILTPKTAWRRIDDAFEVVDLQVPGRELVRDLSPADGLLLAVALALAAEPAAIVVDDVDRSCPAADHTRLWQALSRVCATGCTVLAGACDPPGALDPTPALVALPRLSRNRLPGTGQEGRTQQCPAPHVTEECA
ncbi:ATP-binding cassette domain-containing protein [Kitasatospora sp. NPDC048540]|uniref:ATP-binding cassette domain-containing protein n=1 Tax=unclassified Kitasatospora TaxID=2633591 RepID=UPI0007C7DBC1|nr:ATP-binding cassette domain-containing protein [Kitasatospora sp. MBT63]